MSSLASIQTVFKFQSALGSIGSNPFGAEPDSVKGEETDSLVTGCASHWLLLLALGGIASGVLSMVGTVSVLVNIASISLIMLAPYTVYQKRELRELGGSREQQNELRQEVNKFSAENKKLSSSIDSLSEGINDLQDVEKELQAIVEKSGGQADRMIAIIKENGEIQKKIKRNLEADVMQNALQQILKSDTDGDFKFEKNELRRLRMNLSNIPGVVFDKDNFEKLCGKDQELKVNDIMRMFRNLKEGNRRDSNIFHLQPDKLLKTGGLFG